MLSSLYIPAVLPSIGNTLHLVLPFKEKVGGDHISHQKKVEGNWMPGERIHERKTTVGLIPRNMRHREQGLHSGSCSMSTNNMGNYGVFKFC